MSPTYKITARFGPVVVTTHLHGPITPERLALEHDVAKHRAEQLDHTRPLPKIKIDPEDRDCYIY